MSRIKGKVKKLVQRLGLNVNRYNVYNSPNALLKKCLDCYRIDLVIDVGANVGQYGIQLRDAGYQKRIISFEPLHGVFDKLTKTSVKYGNWEVFNYGVGAENQELVINISDNLASSSFLNVTHLSTEAAKGSQFKDTARTKIVRLDSFLPAHVKNHENIYLKIDVQGFETEVLKGIAAILSMIKVIQVEMSFVPLYEKGPLYDDIISWFTHRGFEIYTIIPGFRNPDSGRMLQADGIFIRGPSSGRD